MRYILIIFIFASFLFCQVAVASNDNSIELVEEFDKNDPRNSPTLNNVLTQENTQMIENEVYNKNEQVIQFDENDPRISSNPNTIVTQENTQMIENEIYNNDGQVKQFDENDPRIMQNR